MSIDEENTQDPTKIPTSERSQAPFEESFTKLFSPFETFTKHQSITGCLLLFSAGLAILLANTDFQNTYQSLNDRELFIGFGEWEFSHSLKHWVNDGLMVFFFFLLGLEVKRECMVGELKNPAKSRLVICIALGGMIVPGFIYYSVAAMSSEPNAVNGWGIPMATDTAFALGILTLLGSKVPKTAPIVLSALAIIDDIGAVLVISIFYTDSIEISALAKAALVLGQLFLGNLLGIRNGFYYLTGGVLLWWFILHSGVHATTAGILAALTIPTRPRAQTSWFVRRIKQILKGFQLLDRPGKSILEVEAQHKLVEQAIKVAEKTSTPLQSWEYRLSGPVSFIILPLFAFLNAGVVIPDKISGVLYSPVMLGTLLGLTLGKSIGITGAAWLVLKLDIARLPDGLSMQHIVGLAFLAGIGFTMSLFITTLAFGNLPHLLVEAKIGIILGSIISGGIGIFLFSLKSKHSETSS